MSDRLIDRVRAKYPQYADVPDAKLTLAIGAKYPAYLERDPKFAANFEAFQQMAANDADTSAVTGLTGERGLVKATVDTLHQRLNAEGDGQPVQDPAVEAQLRAFDAQQQMANEMGRGDLARQIEKQRRQFNTSRGAGTVGDWADTAKPLVSLPRVPAAESVPGQIAAGTANAAIGFAEGLTSPENVALLPMGNAAPVQAFFGASMLGGVVPGARQAVELARQGDVQGATEAAAGTAVAAALGAKLARGQSAGERLAAALEAEIPRAELPPLQRVAALEMTPRGEQGAWSTEQAAPPAPAASAPRSALPAPGSLSAGLAEAVPAEGWTPVESFVRRERLAQSQVALPEATAETKAATKQELAAAREFDRLLIEVGPEAGWVDNLDALAPQMETAKQDATTITARLARSKELNKLRYRAAQTFGANPDDLTPAARAALLPKLRDYVEQEIVPKRQAESLTAAIQPDQGRKPVTTGDLSVGDKLTIDGERNVKVTEVDPDTGAVTLEDGTRFGRNTIADGQTIYVEEWKPTEQSADFAPEAPRSPLPAPSVLDAPESVAEQKARLEREAGQKQAQANREKLAELQAKPLTGSVGDIGQGDLLGGGDLFSAPAPKASSGDPFMDALLTRSQEPAPKAPASQAVNRASEIASEIERLRGQYAELKGRQYKGNSQRLDAADEMGTSKSIGAVNEAKRRKALLRIADRIQNLKAWSVAEATGKLEARALDLFQTKSLEDISISAPPVEGDIAALASRYTAPRSATLASPQQSTLPRSISPAPGAAPAAGEPVSLADIRRYLAKSLDIPVRMGGYGQRAYGIFKTKPEVIRLKALNDIPTLAHETGHYLHKILFPGGGSGTAAYGDFGRRFDTELDALGARTSKPSYTLDQRRMEGVAEFMREYLTDRAQALAKAPNFTAFFESELPAKHPETWEIVTRARTDLARYIQQPALAKVMSHISFDPRLPQPDLRTRVGDWLDTAYTAWVNDLDPINRSLQRLVKLGLNPLQAKAVTDATVNYKGGWRGKAEHTLTFRQTDLAGNDIGPGLRGILLGKDLRKLSAYLVAKRALVKNGQGLKTGLESADAAATVRDLAREFEPVRRQLETFQKNNLRLLREAGILSDNQIALMESANADYVPFHRVLEQPGSDGSQVGGKGGRGFVNSGTGVGKFKGSDRQIIDPLESIVKNTYLFRDLAERNRIGQLFVDAIEQTEGGGRVADQVIRKVQTTQVPHAEVINALERAGIDTSTMLPSNINLAFKLYQAARNQSDPAKGIFTVWRKGKEQRYQTDDADLYRALAMSDGSDVAAAKNFVMGGLRGVASLLRAGAILTPEFMVRNPIRDQFSAAIYAKAGFIPFWDGARGLFHVLKRDDVYQGWQKSGGANAHMTALDRPNLQAALAEVVKDPTVLQQALALADPRNVITNLRNLSQITEEATRVAVFDRARRAGMSEVEAANASKEATLNFARGGVQGRALNRLVAFWNAGIQDLDQFARNHDPRNPKQLARIATKGFLYITMPSLLAWYAGKDDPAIQELPEWRKQFFWNINVGKMLGREDTVISLPKPFLLGQVYGSSVERALDFATQRDPNAVTKWFGQMLGQMPFMPQNLIPTAGRPAVEAMANYSFFRDAPLENQAMQNLPVPMRAGPQTSGVARQVSSLLPDALGASPIKIDNTIRGVLGGMGKYGTDAVDWVMLKAGVGNIPEAPAKTFAELPVVRAFANSPYQASAYVERFYSAVRDVEQNLNALRKSPEIMDTDGQQKFLEAQRERLGFYSAPLGDGTRMTRIRKVAEQLSDVNRAMAQVMRDPKMTPAAKRDRLLELSEIRDRTAAAGFKALYPADQLKFR